MNSYEILIHNMTDDTEMLDVQNALHAAGISDAGDSEVGMYLQDRKPRSVFVDTSEVDKAVEVLHQLNYFTDESIEYLKSKDEKLENELALIKAQMAQYS